MISKMCIGLSAHSGIPSTVVSRDDRVHVAWGEATDPEVKVLGLPAYAATYNRTTGELSQPALIGYGPPPNDIHNSPSIAIDSAGYLHVLGGTHGQPFPYARSLEPNDAGAGWTETVSVGENTRQTYIGFVCDENDTLHLVSHVALQYRASSAEHPRHVGLSAKALRQAVGRAARADRRTVFRIQRLLPPPDNRPSREAIPVLRLLVDPLVLPQRSQGRPPGTDDLARWRPDVETGR